jgi:hypothetical protein
VQLGQIRANAEFVVSALGPQAGFPFGYDRRSVEWLDGYIERIRTRNWTGEESNQLVANLGSFLGEAILAGFGGAWACDAAGWHIRFDEQNRAYPFVKVAKHFTNGAEDSILGFYTATAALRAI